MVKKNIRNRFFRIGFSDDEAISIEKFSNELNITYSEFVRQSVFDKIRNIEHPELKSNDIQPEIDFSILQELIRKIDDQSREINNLKNNLKDTSVPSFVAKYITTLEKIVKTLDLDFGDQLAFETFEDHTGDSAKVIDKIHSLIQEKNALTLEELLDLTPYSEDTIIEVVSKSKLFVFDFNKGKWRLNK